MGYYLRYISSDLRPITLREIDQGLSQADREYSLAVTSGPAATHETAVLRYRGDDVAQIEINTPGDDLYVEELNDFRAELRRAQGGALAVSQTLQDATAVVAVLVTARGVGDPLAVLDPLWDWLFKNRSGLLRADGEGYYLRKQLVMPLP